MRIYFFEKNDRAEVDKFRMIIFFYRSMAIHIFPHEHLCKPLLLMKSGKYCMC
jgi:hypothetical protein